MKPPLHRSDTTGGLDPDGTAVQQKAAAAMSAAFRGDENRLLLPGIFVGKNGVLI